MDWIASFRELMVVQDLCVGKVMGLEGCEEGLVVFVGKEG